MYSHITILYINHLANFYFIIIILSGYIHLLTEIKMKKSNEQFYTMMNGKITLLLTRAEPRPKK